MRNPFRFFNSSPEVIHLSVMMYIRYPLSLKQVEDLLYERGIDNCHETVRFWWSRFGPIFADEIRKKRSATLLFANAGADSIVELRIHADRSDDEKGQWRSLRSSRPCRNSPPYESLSITTSTTTATSPAAPSTASPPLSSGVNWRPETHAFEDLRD